MINRNQSQFTLLLILYTVMFTHAAFAGTAADDSDWSMPPERTEVHTAPYRDHPIIIKVEAAAAFPMYAGSLFVNNGSDFPSPSNLDTFTTKNTVLPVYGVSVGRRFKTYFHSAWRSFTLGARYQYWAPQNIGSTITQYSLSDFRNYNYHWNISAQVLTAEAKANFVRDSQLSPYINFGLGGSFNQANGYTETALADVTARYSAGFMGRSAIDVAWHLGIGFDYDITRDWIISLGYDFESLGQFGSGHGLNDWGSQSLTLGHLNANLILLGLSLRA